MPEARLTGRDGRLVPDGARWFVVNARDARWARSEAFGAFCRFEGQERFPQSGVNIHVLDPGQPACMYHGEADQEASLVLSGECLFVVEGEERLLRAWDFFHCPAWTEHVLVGAGESPCAVLMIGGRAGGGVRYPVAPAAQRHGASVARETSEPREAYADYARPEPAPYRAGDLPG